MSSQKLNKGEDREILQVFREDLYNRIGVYELLKNRTVLDLGCGDGEDADNISKYAKKVIGVDISRSLAWKNNTSKKVTFVKSKAEKLPFKDKTFNGFFLKDVIHHVSDIEKTLAEIKRVTTSRSNIILIEGNRYNPIFYLYATKIHNHQHLTQKGLESVVKKFFPRAEFLYIECYPPFLVKNIAMYKHALSLQSKINKLSFLKRFFSYNVVIIKNK